MYPGCAAEWLSRVRLGPGGQGRGLPAPWGWAVCAGAGGAGVAEMGTPVLRVGGPGYAYRKVVWS